MRQRKMFRDGAIESLEGRQLLSHASPHAANPFAVMRNQAAHFARLNRLEMIAAERATSHVPRFQGSQVFGPSITPSTTPTAATASLYALNPAALGYSAHPLLPSSFQGLGTSSVPTGQSYAVAAPNNAATVAKALALNSANNVTRPNSPGSALVASSSPVASAVPTTSTSATATAPTTPTTANVTSTGTTPLVVTPVTPTMPPVGFLGTSTLSQSDVANLKSMVDAFATSYTGGVNLPADATALATLKSGLTRLGQTVWTETHVATPSAISTLQTAINGFATTYSGGQNATADTAAWTSLNNALQNFASGLVNPEASSGATTTSTPFLIAAGSTFGAPADPFDGVGPLLTGTPLTTAEVTTFRNLVDRLAADDVAGKPLVDQMALSTFQTGLENLAVSHWSVSNPSTATASAQGSSSTTVVNANGIKINMG